MKVVHVVESFGGGVFDFLTDLISGLKEFKHIIIHGIRPDTPKNFKDKFPKGTEFILWCNVGREINPIKDLKTLKDLINHLKQLGNVDILHLHSSKAGFLGRVAARLLKLQNRVVYTPHGAAFLRQDVPVWKRKLFVILEKAAYSLGGTVIACSKSEGEVFKEIGINAIYVYNGIKCPRNILDRKLSKEKIFIGTVGRITFQKGVERFNRIAKAFENDRRIKFVWVGDGELRKVLTTKNIEITGWLDREQVIQKVKDFTIYLSTSFWEGLPLSVLQAMCLGKPLLLSDCIGNRDLVEEGINGYLFSKEEEAVEKIKKLLENERNLELFSINSLNLVKDNFSYEKMVEDYKRVYKSLLAK